MGAAFCIIADEIRYPTVAMKYARHKSLGSPSLAEARGGSRDATDDERYTFPDDSCLLMIGHTQQLLDACKDAYDAGTRRIETQSHRVVGLRYVRLEISSVETDTLIAIGAKDLLPDSSTDGWREHRRPWLGDYVLTADDVADYYSLPPMIRGIKDFFADAWHTEPPAPPLRV
jgi:hypothetical protein